MFLDITHHSVFVQITTFRSLESVSVQRQGPAAEVPPEDEDRLQSPERGLSNKVKTTGRRVCPETQ